MANGRLTNSRVSKMARGKEKSVTKSKESVATTSQHTNESLDIAETIKKAEAGDVIAQYNLGTYYLTEGVDKYEGKVAFWYTKAAEQGHADAQNVLGCLYLIGMDLEQSSEKAVFWFEKAAEQGYANAQRNIGVCYYKGYGIEKDYEKAMFWFEKAAKQGDAQAQFNIGTCYYKGYGIEKDYEKAVFWFEKAAKQGDKEAQYKMGVCYYKGYGVEKDYEKTVFWFEKAAEQGYRDAQLSIGSCYHNGTGVDQNFEKAEFWYKKAAEQGDEQANECLKNLYQECHGEEQSTINIVEKENKEEDSKSKLESKESKAENESKNNVLQKTTSISTNLLGKMKEEAIKRMIVLRISSEVIYKFANNDTLCVSYPPNGSFYEAEEEDLKHIKEFEEQHNALVYSVIRCQTNYGLIDNFLYVSSTTLWDEERAAIENRKAYAYSYNHDNPNISELGLIGIQRTDTSGLFRTW